jgi:hypothetical protein
MDECSAPLPWLWHGYLLPGNITLFTSAPKCGKTTLLALLLHHLRGGGSLAGQALRPGKALVLTEESSAIWQDRRRRLSLSDHVCFSCRPFRTRPTPDRWEQTIDRLLELTALHAFDLVAFDPLASFLSASAESHAPTMLDWLGPLHRLAERGLCVLLLHHPSRRERGLGLSARGSLALVGFADIIVELHRVRGAAAGGVCGSVSAGRNTS